ncbi:MAG: deaminase [Myxococcota bacterium]|nr:deaminase [Myxococcota bacterium]
MMNGATLATSATPLTETQPNPVVVNQPKVAQAPKAPESKVVAVAPNDSVTTSVLTPSIAPVSNPTTALPKQQQPTSRQQNNCSKHLAHAPQLTPDQIEALGAFRTQTVGEVAAIEPHTFTPAQKERHRLYSLMLMALMHKEWNGNKYGANGDYGWRSGQKEANGTYNGGRDYKGHNIAAIAVDKNGAVIDFDFNHNALFRSSMEHAEARLVKRVFGLNQVQDSRRSLGGNTPEHDKKKYGNMLKNVTIYTSLESCSQCTGIMMLGRVKDVVYMQPDTGMYNIGNILYNLTKDGGLSAPEPVAANEFGLPYFKALADGFREFKEGMSEEKPFVVFPGGKKKTTTSITSFLCTDIAHEIFKAAHDEFVATNPDSLKFGEFKPTDTDEDKGLSNQEVLAEVKDFFNYAVKNGGRGTPHH